MNGNGPNTTDKSARRIQETIDTLWDQFVDPNDAWYDSDGARWDQLGSGEGPGGGVPFRNEAQLREIREACRALAMGNEFAINGHENRISYIVGTGHAYRATPRVGNADAQPLADAVQEVIEQFLRVNHWQRRQQEIVRRKDRDGECFIRFFDAPDGVVRVRFIEPDQVSAPTAANDDAASFGILTDPHDVEQVQGYYVDGRLVDAAEIQHRKANVDVNVKRGLPLFYPVRKNLRRVEKLLRNMSVVAEIQSAIAIIRKHSQGTRSGVEQFVQSQADATATSTATGRTSHFRRYGPGTILDALAGVEYEFPASGLDASRYVAVLQADLRAIASRLVMPEFMLTSDASNAAYASTMVAEGPAVKMFLRLQHEMLEEDLDVMWHVVDAAIRAGTLSAEVRRKVDIRGIPPTLTVRDRMQEAQADEILLRNGAMSVQTLAMRHGLDPDRELHLIQQRKTSE